MKYLTTQQLADKAELKQMTIRWHILKGNLKASKVGRDWLISNTKAKDFLTKYGKKQS